MFGKLSQGKDAQVNISQHEKTITITTRAQAQVSDVISNIEMGAEDVFLYRGEEWIVSLCTAR